MSDASDRGGKWGGRYSAAPALEETKARAISMETSATTTANMVEGMAPVEEHSSFAASYLKNHLLEHGWWQTLLSRMNVSTSRQVRAAAHAVELLSAAGTLRCVTPTKPLL